ncbi:TetR family transcriptional regulator C-terminal domain-containing protein [Brevibacterium casei]|uniref:TetR family transcriptional regulator C-terminal domain-containing protein n=1 Tax=Brevibacterium casei TaxID=33889 RepID=UPI00370418CF
MHPRSFPIPGCSCGAHGHRTTEVLILSRAEALLSRPFPCGCRSAAVRSPKSHSPGIRDQKRSWCRTAVGARVENRERREQTHCQCHRRTRPLVGAGLRHRRADRQSDPGRLLWLQVWAEAALDPSIAESHHLLDGRWRELLRQAIVDGHR